jgi:hypothetical protein
VLQHEGACTNGALGFPQVAELLHHFGGDDHHIRHVGERVEQPDEGLVQEELDGIAIHHLDPVHRLQEITGRIALDRQEAVKRKLHVLGYEFAAVEGRFVVPLHPLAQVEKVGRLIGSLPAFGKMGLHREGAWWHCGTEAMPHQRTVDETQRRCRPEGPAWEMGVEVGWVKTAHTEGATALGLAVFRPPERRGQRQRPGRQRDTSRESRFEHCAAVYALDHMRIRLHRFHRYPSCLHRSD